MLLSLKELDAALSHALRGNAAAEQLYRINPANARWRRNYQVTLSSAGVCYSALAEKDPSMLPVAISYLERSYALAADSAREDPKNAVAKDDMIVQSHRYAHALTKAKRFDEAARLYEGAGKAAQELVAARPKDRR